MPGSEVGEVSRPWEWSHQFWHETSEKKIDTYRYNFVPLYMFLLCELGCHNGFKIVKQLVANDM